MSDGSRLSRGRRPGENRTKAAILQAARKLFAERGFDAAGIRDIASGAQVDPALVHHYFGNKESLFAAAMRLPNIPELLTGAIAENAEEASARKLGEILVRRAIRFWEEPAFQRVMAGLLRSALTRPSAAIMLREAFRKMILEELMRAVGPPDADLRASLVASQMFGLFMARYLLHVEPLASLPAQEIPRLIGPTLQHYLDAEL